MLLAMSAPKKPVRLCEWVVKFPKIQECDHNIEVDSLDGCSVSLDISETGDENHIASDDSTATTSVKHLNLNGLCKKNVEMDECYVEEIVLPSESIQSLSELQILSLRSNGIQNFPNSILQLSKLVTLDLSDNNLLTLPQEISQLKQLQELVLDTNLLSILPVTLWDLKFLKVLKVASNRLAVPPDKELKDMKALVLTESEDTLDKSRGLTTLNLRSNRLKGHIILGNYGSLTELDVSENNIEQLDLSAVEQLQVLRCSRNSLISLTVHGKKLVSIIAGNNRLTHFSVICPPVGLKHLDISYNILEALPDWLCGCNELRSLFASNNAISSLPDHLFCNEMPFLHTLQLAYNQLQYLPMIQRRLPIQDLFLQNNSLSCLPDNLFKCMQTIKVLNLSNNRLCDLPKPDEVLQLEKLYLTANCLIDKSLEKIAPFLRNLKILHAAYNNFTILPENCDLFWTDLEELVISGNKLLKLPDNINRLQHLSVLRVHSNLLQTIPKLSILSSLRILDLAQNQLDRIDLTALTPPNLKFLDLSCNTKLHVDSQQFNNYRTQRPMSLVDVSGKNRTSLPLTPSPFCENDLTDYSWSVGFSETAGCKQRLYVSQIRLPAFCNTEALFGMFDGESNNDIPFGVDKFVPRILLEERTVKETAHDYMKYTMLSIHRELKDKLQRRGLNAVLVHVLKSKQSASELAFTGVLKKYTMKIACVGDIKVVLGRASGPVRLLPIRHRKQIRTNPQMHLTVPDPDITEINLEEHDEYMIIANKNLWEVMSPESGIREVTLQRNVILAAKRLQDLAQSYGAEENLSIIVVKFNLLGSDVDLLMRELRQTIRKNKFQNDNSKIPLCQPGCCCETLSNECMTSCSDKIPIPPPMMICDDRSSPSGQSEHACSDCNSSAKLFVNQMSKHENRSVRSVTPSIFESVEIKTNPERRSYRGVAKMLRQKKEDEKNREDSDSALSEEQFKCWEYMLEQNTQLLFDKELNTLNRSARSRPFSIKTPSLSRSSPHLSDTNNNTTNNSSTGTFLSKQFGSARSFNPLMSKSSAKLAAEKNLLGGPNAAYFGSLQRLMPYNLEYDFAVMQERGLADSLDLDRMQQYWGVTTTEL